MVLIVLVLPMHVPDRKGRSYLLIPGTRKAHGGTLLLIPAFVLNQSQNIRKGFERCLEGATEYHIMSLYPLVTLCVSSGSQTWLPRIDRSEGYLTAVLRYQLAIRHVDL
jgi:hypothetical protein